MVSMWNNEMEIHQRYYTTDTRNIKSDEMFELIRLNKISELLLLFQNTPSRDIYPLINTKNSNYNDMLPVNYTIKCSASHIILIMLLRLGAKYEDSTDSPLLVAVRSGLMNLVKLLIISGADMNVLDKDGYSALHWAAFKNNILMVRLILKVTNFYYHNHDRNRMKISPLGIAIERNNLNLVREMLKCPKVCPNIIDTKTQRYLYDLAAESGQLGACLEMEKAFIRLNPRFSKREIRRNFYNLHEYTVEAVIHHQFRTRWLTFKDDPSGPYEPLNYSTLRLPLLPNSSNWKVITEEGSMDSVEGWKYSFTCETEKPMIINFKGDEMEEGGGLFDYIDNYRYRLLARIIKNK